MKTSEILMAIARSKHGQWLGSAEHISMSGRSPARTTIQLVRGRAPTLELDPALWHRAGKN